MPGAKASKAYKFARPFYGPYRVVAVYDTGSEVRPVDKPTGDQSALHLTGCADALNRSLMSTGRKENGPAKLTEGPSPQPLEASPPLFWVRYWTSLRRRTPLPRVRQMLRTLRKRRHLRTDLLGFDMGGCVLLPSPVWTPARRTGRCNVVNSGLLCMNYVLSIVLMTSTRRWPAR